MHSAGAVFLPMRYIVNDLGAIQHFCFDKDGVLIDVHHYWASVIAARARTVCRRVGIDSQDIEDLLITAMGVDTTRLRIKPGGPVGYAPRSVVAEAALRALNDAWEGEMSRHDIDEIFLEVDATTQKNLEIWCAPIPGVDQALADLWKDDRRLSIVTSDRSVLASRTMELRNLRQMFTTVIGGDRVKIEKPDPEGILLACEEVGVSTIHTAYVGDTLGDMKAAKAAGVLAVGITSGLADAEELGQVADLVISNLTELLSY